MICKICNKKCYSLKQHIQQEHYDLYHNKSIDEINKLYFDSYIDTGKHICPICGNESKFNYKYFPGSYNTCCSSLSCVRKYQFNNAKDKWEAEHPGHSYSEHLNEKGKRGAATIKKNLQAKYVEHITNVSQLQYTKDKVKQTFIEKYGGYYTQTDEYKQRVKELSIEKYGVDSPNKFQSKIDKYKQTCLEKYGTDNYFGSKENREHIKEIVMEKYGVDNVIKLASVQDKIAETKKKNGTATKSKIEDKVYKILVSMFGKKDVKTQYRSDRYKNPLNGYKFKCDFYIRSKDLFIEIQGSNAHGYEPYSTLDINDRSLYNIKMDRRPSISPRNFAYMDILKRSVAIHNKLNYIEIFYKRENHYTEETIQYILNNYNPGTNNVFVTPYKKFDSSHIYYYNITYTETIKQLVY